MNILITGGNGLIGLKLVNDLLKNTLHNIFLISRGSYIDKSNKKLKSICHDLLLPIPDDKIPKDIDIVIHLAAIAHETNSDVMLSNCTMTKNIVSAFINKKIRFIFFSSVAIYGEANRNYPIRVDDYCKPFSSYGKGKLKDENLVSESFDDFAILRICPVIEGRDNKDLQKRVFIPKTNIKYKSPYQRSYNFTSHKIIYEYIIDFINNKTALKVKLNVKDSLVYTESYVLSKFKGKEVKIPLILCSITFYFLNLFSFIPKIYSINCLLWKMLKTNTYE